MLLHSNFTALQLTLIFKHHISYQNAGSRHETPSQHCDGLRLWQLHSKKVLFLKTCIKF